MNIIYLDTQIWLVIYFLCLSSQTQAPKPLTARIELD